jgi:undecaprenyl diphosphate synthase
LEENLNHLGVILDGNRRYAKKIGVELSEAYKHGADKVYTVVRHIFEKTSIAEISIYALSYDNLLRKSEDLNAVLKIQKDVFDKWTGDPFFKEKGIRIRFVGDRGILPTEFRKSCERLEAVTSGNGNRTLNMLVAYGGRRDISSAVRKVLLNAKDLNNLHIEKRITENLDIKNPVDLVIRTAGGRRLSGFLLWQSDYADIITLDMLWPEIELADIDRAIAGFCSEKTKRGR